jgi:DNA-directed DNA polymerase III PolC
MLNLKKFNSPMPVGVRLPGIEVDRKVYYQLDLDPKSSNYDLLRALCLRGVKERGIDKFKNKQEYYDRVKIELSVLNDLGFVDYILLNWDILNFCHYNSIPTGPGRGSAAGSLVLFLLKVTNVDPIKYDLFFERFVSKSRAKKTVVDDITYLDGSLLADVDNDISYDRRGEVIKYIEDKHKGKTCKILTLNTLSSKLCVKECGKIVGEMSEDEVNSISNHIPKQFGKVAKLEKAYDESAKFKEFADENTKIYKIAKKLEGLNKNTGVHPSGIAISFYNIEEIMPMQVTNDGNLVSAYDMNDVASLMVKFDILGLRTLSVVHDTCKQLGLDVENIDVELPEIYENFKLIEAPKGLFQIEADTNFKVCKKISPRSLEELSAVVAIARPGALDYLDTYADYRSTGNFQSVNEYFDDILSHTGGIPLYQEQLMKMAVKVGFTLDEAEQLRRIVGKKKVDQMPAWKAKIEKKIEENNLSKEVGEVLWKVAEDSANYSFNKSHSISYAILAAITTYLKFNHPKEFFLSLLKMTKHEPDSHAEIALISQELCLFNMKLLPPDLSKSDINFNIEGNNIRFGVNSVKGVSEKTLENLVEFRKAQESNQNKYDIFVTAKQCGINIGVLSGLIQGGMMDSFCQNRQGAPNRCRLVLEAQAFNILTDREKRNIIQLGNKYNFDVLNTIHTILKESLIADDGKLIMKPSRFQTFKKKYESYKLIYEKNKQHLEFANWFFERKYLGYSHSTEIKKVFQNSDNLYNSLELKSVQQNDRVKFVGVVLDCVSRTSRNGNKYMRAEVQDDFGKVNFMLANNRRSATLDQYLDNGGKKPKGGEIVFVYGSKGEDIIFGEKLTILDEKIYTKLSEVK